MIAKQYNMMTPHKKVNEVNINLSRRDDSTLEADKTNADVELSDEDTPVVVNQVGDFKTKEHTKKIKPSTITICQFCFLIGSASSLQKHIDSHNFNERPMEVH